MRRAIGFSILCVLVGSVSSLAADTSDTRKAVAQRVFDEILNAGRFDVAAQLYADDFVNHGATRDVGLDEDQNAARGWRSAAPDLVTTIDKLLAEGEFVVVLWHAEGTNTGSGNGLPATGKRVKTRGITIWRILDGKIHEEWSVFDQAGIMLQLGLLVPAPSR
jgi:steroid delta-isomerase-like uncharacterized protein